MVNCVVKNLLDFLFKPSGFFLWGVDKCAIIFHWTIYNIFPFMCVKWQFFIYLKFAKGLLNWTKFLLYQPPGITLMPDKFYDIYEVFNTNRKHYYEIYLKIQSIWDRTFILKSWKNFFYPLSKECFVYFRFLWWNKLHSSLWNVFIELEFWYSVVISEYISFIFDFL